MKKQSILIAIFVILIIFGIGIYFNYINNESETNENQSKITQEEAKVILSDSYNKVKKYWIGLIDNFELGEEITVSENGYDVPYVELIDYDKTMNFIFTQRAKEKYEEKLDLYKENGKVYNIQASGLGYDYVGEEFTNIIIGNDVIESTVINTFNVIGEENNEQSSSSYRFVIKKVNDKWLIDEYTSPIQK